MATPTFNKYKSTTIYGNLSVRDLTNSSGTSVVEVASVDLSGNFISRGNSTFTKAVTCNGTITNATDLTTKSYVDSAVSGGGTSLLASPNAWTNTNTFNTNLPTSTQTPTSSSQLTTKTYVDGGISTAISGLSSVYQPLASMSSYLTTATASSTYQTISGMSSYLTTASASSTYSTITNEVKTNTANAFTSTNTFNSNFPTSTLPTSTTITDNSIVNKGMNNTLYGRLANENTWYGIQILNNNIAHLAGEINQDRTLPSGAVNKFVYTNFLEAVQFGAGFSQNGTNTNTLDNLTLDSNLTTNKRINLTTDNSLPAPSLNQLGYFYNGTFSTSAITSATQTNLSQISLAFGIYVVVANVVFQSNATIGTISKYQIGFNNTSGTAFTSCITGYGGNTTLATTASNTSQLSLTITDIVSAPSSATLVLRVIANITYATTTISVNTSLCKFTAVRIA